MWTAIACSVAASYAAHLQGQAQKQAQAKAGQPQAIARKPDDFLETQRARDERMARDERRVLRSAMFGTALILALILSAGWVIADALGAI